jgi:hypothetical protein
VMKTEGSVLAQDVQRRVAVGITPEMAAAQRRRFATLQGLLLLSLVINLLAALADRAASSWQVVLWASAVGGLAALMVRGYRRLVAHPGRTASEAELAEVASRSQRCGRCQNVILPEERECPQCGVLRHPSWTLAFGIAFGVGMTALALWRAGLFG